MEIECRVNGKVQQVMYRDFVQRKARDLHLVGEVANTPDWSVRVIAQGEEGDLEKLIEYLNKGPFLARVSSVAVTWREPSRTFTDFSIKY